MIDAEHGHLDWKEIARAPPRGCPERDGCPGPPRRPRSRTHQAGARHRGRRRGRFLGSRPRSKLRRAVAFARYPPEGCRGIGAERATGWGECMRSSTRAEANDNVLVMPIVETVRTADGTVPRICQVDGVEVVFFGPADYSATAGFRGQWEGPGVARTDPGRRTPSFGEAGRALRSAGDRDAEPRPSASTRAFGAIGLGIDGGLLLRRSLHESLAAVGRDRAIRSGDALD